MGKESYRSRSKTMHDRHHSDTKHYTNYHYNDRFSNYSSYNNNYDLNWYDNNHRSRWEMRCPSRGQRYQEYQHYSYHTQDYSYKWPKIQKEVDPISKESEDTLRTRIRNETQFQEERDKKRQDLVKDKVKELQRKLTTAPADSQQNNNEDLKDSTETPSNNVSSTSTTTNLPLPVPLPNPPSLSPVSRDPHQNKSTVTISAHQDKAPISNSPHQNDSPIINTPCQKTFSISETSPQNNSKKVPSESSSLSSNNRKRESKSCNNKKRRKKPIVSPTIKLNITASSDSSSKKKRKRKKSTESRPNSIPETSQSVLDYELFKASIAKKDHKYLKELIESPSFLKKVLMTKLVEDHRKQISEKLNQLRFNNKKPGDLNDPLSEASDPFGQVEFKELPQDFISEISNLILRQKLNQENLPIEESNKDDPNIDEDIIEVPVPPKTPPPCFNLSDGEEINEKSENKERQKLFAEKLNKEIEILNQEENDVNDMLDKLSKEKNTLIDRLTKISFARRSLLLESVELLNL